MAKFNPQGNSNQTTPPEVEPLPNTSVPAQPPTNKAIEAITAKIKWLGKQLVGARPWIGRDEREYATVSTTSNSPNEDYANPIELALELLETAKSERTYVTYKLRMGNKTADARLISVREETSELVFALDTEYAINGAVGSLTSLAAKSQPSAVTNDNVQADDIGF